MYAKELPSIKYLKAHLHAALTSRAASRQGLRDRCEATRLHRGRYDYDPPPPHLWKHYILYPKFSYLIRTVIPEFVHFTGKVDRIVFYLSSHPLVPHFSSLSRKCCPIPCALVGTLCFVPRSLSLFSGGPPRRREKVSEEVVVRLVHLFFL